MHTPQSYYCCLFLLVSCLTGFTQSLEDYTWPQTYGYFILENEPELNRQNQVSEVLIFKTETDSLGTPTGSPKLIVKHGFDLAGFKIETIYFDSLNNQEMRYEYLEPRELENFPPPLYSQILTYDEKDHLTDTLGDVGGEQTVLDHTYFKPCYDDFLYIYYPSGLKKGALWVLPNTGIIMGNKFRAGCHFTFVYSFFDD